MADTDSWTQREVIIGLSGKQFTMMILINDANGEVYVPGKLVQASELVDIAPTGKPS